MVLTVPVVFRNIEEQGERSALLKLRKLKVKYARMFPKHRDYACDGASPEMEAEHLEHCLKNRIRMEDAFPEWYPKMDNPAVIY